MRKPTFLFTILILLLSSVSFAAALPIKIPDTPPAGGGTGVNSITHVYFSGKQITSIDSNNTRLYYYQD